MYINKSNLPKGDWKEYRKKGTTKMIPFVGPGLVETKEGEYNLPEGWRGYIAIDSDGDPYPIEAKVQWASYEEVNGNE